MKTASGGVLAATQAQMSRQAARLVIRFVGRRPEFVLPLDDDHPQVDRGQKHRHQQAPLGPSGPVTLEQSQAANRFQGHAQRNQDIGHAKPIITQHRGGLGIVAEQSARRSGNRSG